MRTTHSEMATAMPSIAPAAVIVHPDQVLNHPTMTIDEKRHLLSSWASDARTVENAPGLRRLGSGAICPVADILAALNALAVGDRPPESGGKAASAPAPRRRRLPLTHWRSARRSREDDDDGPTGGAAALGLAPAYSVSG